MIQIKKFIDRISVIEGKNSKDFVMSLTDARALRDELSKLLIDLYSSNQEKKQVEESVIKVDIKGGTFK